MRVALDIRNMSKLTKPTKNDVIVYDGKEWYITTKDDLLKAAMDLVHKCEQTLADIKQENQQFKEETSSNIKEIADTAQNLLRLKGE